MSEILHDSQKKFKIKKKFNLKDGAVPSIFVFSEMKQKRPPNILAKTREREGVLSEITMVEQHQGDKTIPSLQEASTSTYSTYSACYADTSDSDRNSQAENNDSTNDSSFCETIDDDRCEFFEDDVKFVISWKHIKELFRYCLNCGAFADVTQVYTKGIALFVKLECTVGHKITWSSNSIDERNGVNVVAAASKKVTFP